MAFVSMEIMENRISIRSDFPIKYFWKLSFQKENSLINLACEKEEIQQHNAETGNWVTEVREKKTT